VKNGAMEKMLPVYILVYEENDDIFSKIVHLPTNIIKFRIVNQTQTLEVFFYFVESTTQSKEFSNVLSIEERKTTTKMKNMHVPRDHIRIKQGKFHLQIFNV
jgi:hypothetical protein